MSNSTSTIKNKREHPRKIHFVTNINPYAQGSVIVEFGNTKVHVTAIVQNEVPPFLKGQGKGWVTAEYAMLPAATHTRNQRERKSLSGRSQEIQRLIGRSLRAAVDTKILGERSILIDCDVLVADGGTRTASITGAYVALALAIKSMMSSGQITENPLRHQIAAVSVGISKKGEILADLNYDEDSNCETDLNLVMTNAFDLVEIQGTAEGMPFSLPQLHELIDCGKKALSVIFAEQNKILNQ